MKKLVIVLASVALVAALSAGPASAKSQDPPGPQDARHTDGRPEPAVARLPDGKVAVRQATSSPNARGMEIDMANAIAKKLGLKKVVFINNNFQNMYLPGPKKWDFGLAEMTITAERKKNIDFSVPYINANQGVMVRKGLSTAAEVDRRPQGPHAVRADRHHGRRVHQGPDQADQAGALPAEHDDHVPAAQVGPL